MTSLNFWPNPIFAQIFKTRFFKTKCQVFIFRRKLWLLGLKFITIFCHEAVLLLPNLIFGELKPSANQQYQFQQYASFATLELKYITHTRVYIFTRFVFIHFVCTFYIDILGKKIDLEIPSGLAWCNFVKSNHATLLPSQLLISRSILQGFRLTSFSNLS